MNARIAAGDDRQRLLAVATIGCMLAVAAIFAFNVRRHWFIADDAFISFRYAKHLAEGHGLVWNISEPPVEGYTNFLWTLLMALGIRLSIPPENLSLVLGVSSGAAVLIAVMRLGRSHIGMWHPLSMVPAVLLAANRSFAGWSSGGLETQMFTLWVFLALTLFAREHERRVEGPAISSVFFILAGLTRPEGLLFAAVAGLWLAIGALRGQRSMRALLWWALPVLLVAGAHFVWRWSYYGYWLPNTFYAKVSGLWWEQSSKYLAAFFFEYSWHFFLPCLLLYPVIARRVDVIFSVFMAAGAAYVAYVIYVGGDVFEFRFMVPILPLLYVGVGLFCGELRFALRRVFHRPHAVAAAASVVPVFLVALALTQHGRAHPPATEDGIETIAWTRLYGEYRIREGKRLKELVERGVLPADLRYATGAAGAAPYYSELYTLDFLGLNDAHIAHQPMTRRGVIAHEKRASAEYLREKRIAVIDTQHGVVFDEPWPEAVVGDPPQYCRGPLKCARFDGGYLIFETALSDTELFAILDRVEFLPDAPARLQPSQQ